MNLPSMDWSQTNFFSTCTPIDHPDYIMPFGQTVKNELFTDDSQFYCLNRGDTNPFLAKTSGNNESEADSKTWTQWMNTPCPEPYSITKRRCLGSTPDICVDASCKYNYIHEIR